MIERLVAKLYRGECSQEELETLFNLLQENDDRPSDSLLMKIWEDSGKSDEHVNGDRDRIFNKIQSKIGTVHRSSIGGKKLIGKERTRKINWMMSAAAAVALLMASAFYFWPTAPTPKVVQTSFGEQRSVEFLDGSRLRLNANSKITYLSDQTWHQDKPRTVWLEGEAYFNVERQQKANQTFEVRTDDALVEVLGTAFNVHASEDRMQVYLDHGSIRLHLESIDTTVLMQPGDLVTYDKGSKTFLLQNKVEAALHTSWKDGVLPFNDSPLREVITKMEQIYGVQFQVSDDSIYERSIEFPMPTASLETAISILDKTLVDLEIRQQGQTFIVQ